MEAVGRFDYSPLAIFTDEQFGRRSLCGWLHQQFTLEMRPEEFENLSPEDAVALVRRKIEELYRQKEIEFPVAVGMTNFMAEGPGGGGERYNREGLIRWANDRFQATLPIEQVKDQPRNEIENLLKESSRRFFVNGELIEKTDEYLDQAYPNREKPPEACRFRGTGKVVGKRSWASSRSGRKTSLDCRLIRASWSPSTTTGLASGCSTRTTHGIAPSCTRLNGHSSSKCWIRRGKITCITWTTCAWGLGWWAMPNWIRRSSTSTRAQDLPLDVGPGCPAGHLGNFPHREGKPGFRRLAVADHGGEPRRSGSHDE